MPTASIVRGLKDHFGGSLEIHETQCMHSGASCCRFDLVRMLPGAAPRAEFKARAMPEPALES